MTAEDAAVGLPDSLADLIDYDAATLRVKSREGRKLEFKESFVKGQLASYERTMAAFANTLGGIIIFGVSDKPRLIVGTDPAGFMDEADITTRLRADFSPELPFDSKTYQVGALTVLAFCIEPGVDRPVICQKTRSKQTRDAQGNNPRDEIGITDATIYYRYSAQTTAIAYTELRALLDEREERRLRIIMETLKAVERVGYEKVGVVDATSFGDPAKATNLYVSKETARSMNFIDHGRFTETADDSSPAYLVVGRVSLGEVVHAPMEDADKNLPNEVATTLLPLVHELYGITVSLPVPGIKALLGTFGLMDMPYHEWDTKIGRRYVTRAGINELKARMIAEPLKALQSFGSKKTIKTYEDGLAAAEAAVPPAVAVDAAGQPQPVAVE
ncbi:MAG: helix-turn-helix domain-containing protein [Cypionkella sp.]